MLTVFSDDLSLIPELRKGRLIIAGGPQTGKTTLSHEIASGRRVRHTDDLIDEGWSKSSDDARQWIREPGEWVIEGVAAVRAIRKILREDKVLPVDVVLYLTGPYADLDKGQRAMTTGCKTIWGGIVREVAEMCLVVERTRR